MSVEHAQKIASHFSPGSVVAISPIAAGSINTTYRVTYSKDGAEHHFILQKMHAVFSPKLMETLDAIYPILSEANVAVPEPLSTHTGDWHVSQPNGSWWRAISYLEGTTHHNNVTPKMARSAGSLIGRFHSALASYDAPIPEPLPHFHDTPYIMERLDAMEKQYVDSEKYDALLPLADSVRAHYVALNTQKLYALPHRVIHADLKISNLLFDAEQHACALIDMDTVMRHTIAVEMGDALRSWCATAGEDADVQRFDAEVCTAALEGYFATATFLTDEEHNALLNGVSLITLELTARYIIDAYEESYFVKKDTYPTLFEQNHARAKRQLSFLADFVNKKDRLAS